MKMACEINEKVKERIPSTKGMIENKWIEEIKIVGVNWKWQNH